MKTPEPQLLELNCLVDEPLWLESYRQYCLRLLEVLEIKSHELSVTLCDDAFIQDLNYRFRGKNEPTDVLSFEQEAFSGLDPRDNREIRGDLVISLPTLEVNSRYFQVPLEEELRRVTLHGCLHLQGWDHATNQPEEPMLRHQEDLLRLLATPLFH